MREWINKMLYIHTMDYYAALKGNSNSDGFSINSSVGRGVPNNSLALAGCPTIQLSSDTIYQDITADPTAEGLSIISTSDANHKFRSLPVLLTSPWLQIRGSHNPLSGSDEFVRVTHRTQEICFLIRLLVLNKGY